MATMAERIASATSNNEFSNLLASNLFGIYPAKSYLKCDGATDDYEALYSLINTTINGDDAEIWFPDGTALIGTSITIPSNIKLVFLDGGKIKPASGAVITGSSAKIQAGLHQIFDLSASGNTGIAGTWDVDTVYTTWLGAVGDGTTDCTVAIQAAINMLEDTGGRIYTPNGTFLISSPITFPNNNNKFKFEGESDIDTLFTSSIVSTSADACFKNIGNASSRSFVHYKNFNMLGNDDANTTGIYSKYGGSYTQYENVQIRSFYDGIRISTDYNVIVTNAICISNNNNGITIGLDLDDTAGACNVVKLIRGIYDANTANGIYIKSARTGNLTGVTAEGNANSNILLDTCYGIDLSGTYMEDPSTAAVYQMYLESCIGITINGLSVSNFVTNQIVMYVRNCNGVKISGVSVERGAGSLTGTAFYVENSKAVVLDSSTTQDISDGLKVFGAASDVTMINVNITGATTPVTTANGANVKLDWYGANSSLIASCSFGLLSEVSLTYTDGQKHNLGMYKTFLVTPAHTDLASAATLDITSRTLPSDQWYVRDIFIVPSINFSGGGGDRDLAITDGTYEWSTIPAATLQAQTQDRWGATAVPFSSTASHMLQACVQGADIYVQYSGGSADYLAGQINILLVCEKAA